MTNIKTEVKISLCHLRLPAHDKAYWLNQFRKFANLMDSESVQAVQYGKQDTRGAHSITLVDWHHCVPKQMHFATKEMLLGYVQGYVAAKDAATWDDFQNYCAA